MLRIRLSRTGKKGQPSFRVVVADKDAPRDGRIVEHLGHYNPRTDPVEYRIKEARALHWLNVGAQPSEAVYRLLVKQGTLDRLARLRAGETLESLAIEFEEAQAEAEAIDAAAVAEVAAAVGLSEEE